MPSYKEAEELIFQLLDNVRTRVKREFDFVDDEWIVEMCDIFKNDIDPNSPRNRYLQEEYRQLLEREKVRQEQEAMKSEPKNVSCEEVFKED